jgi:hypothetical protein
MPKGVMISPMKNGRGVLPRPLSSFASSLAKALSS